MLKLNNLSISVGSQQIVSNFSLAVNPGEMHVLLGPNGSGKSTLAAALMGHPDYCITSGEAMLDGQDLLALTPDKRAQIGFFLSFQTPVAIPGLKLESFLRSAVNQVRESQKKSTYSVLEFRKKLQSAIALLGLDASFLARTLNDGFSGGERKRCEIMQFLLFEPKYAILDECDSGLDVDALRLIGGLLNRARTSEQGVVLITHSPQLLSYIEAPKRVHIIRQGALALSGQDDLITNWAEHGFQNA
ncbi:Fe-S cluster assembly ATPase SufC [Candidatus Berkelbacteria bacterium]|nr:Fe-S cluster assembly ATPase SufC [Candidatus Berkelbacteria bacterium]